MLRHPPRTAGALVRVLLAAAFLTGAVATPALAARAFSRVIVSQTGFSVGGVSGGCETRRELVRCVSWNLAAIDGVFRST